jgi:hypothetical protein
MLTEEATLPEFALLLSAAVNVTDRSDEDAVYALHPRIVIKIGVAASV